MTGMYLIFSFISIYFVILYHWVHFKNRNKILEAPKPKKDYTVSIVMPCYNESATIKQAIENMLKSSYKGLEKIYVVDDCSTDNSYEIIKSLAEKYEKVVALQTPKNSGNAAGSKNYGAQFVTSDLIGFSDADSFPRKDSISKMVGFFNDEKVGGVTSKVLVKNRNNVLSKIQSVEYKLVGFTRKLLGFLEAIYVTNGPLGIFRLEAFKDVNGFDEKNMTEDIEIAWHLAHNGWKIRMGFDTEVYTVVPESLKVWFKQRIRWSVGGIQTFVKYKKETLKSGILGKFIIPFFVMGWILGLIGLGFLLYRGIRRLSLEIMSMSLSKATDVAFLTRQDFQLAPSVLWYFGILTLILGLILTFFSILKTKEKEGYVVKLKDIFFFSFFYLLSYPPILIYAGYKCLKGKHTW